MVEAVSSPGTSSRTPPEDKGSNPTRPPLLPSEKDSSRILSKRPKAREVTSRYLFSPSSSSPSSSRRCLSPLVYRTSQSPDLSVKRSQSVERRRPTPAGSTADAGKFWTTTRSLAVSFQAEAFSLPVSKQKAAVTQSAATTADRSRKTTPLRGKIERPRQSENSTPRDNQRWPASRTRHSESMTRSLNCVAENAAKIAVISAASVESASDCSSARDLATSDSDSVSSGSNSGVSDSTGSGSGRPTIRAPVFPALLRQETSRHLLQDQSLQKFSPSPTRRVFLDSTGAGRGRLATRASGGDRPPPTPARLQEETYLHLLQDPSSPNFAPSPANRMFADSPASSHRMSRRSVSPLPARVRPPSPSKPSTSLLTKRIISPSRVRTPSAMSNDGQQSNSSPAIPSFSLDSRRRKLDDSRIDDVHHLRLLYGRHVQWRFANAKADAAFAVQSLTAKIYLYNVWATTSELRNFVATKKNQLQAHRQNLKIATVLKGQMTYLEDWALMESGHSNSLLGAIENIKAITLFVPVMDGAQADLCAVKDAVVLAIDVMQAMGSSVCSLLLKVKDVDMLMTNLARIVKEEISLLALCKGLLSSVAAMQMEESSLRAHLLQLRQARRLTLLSEEARL